jgi:Zn-dependent protease
MNSNIRIGKLFGIPFYINPSWFLVFGLVTFTYSQELASLFPQLPGGLPVLLGLVTALLLFASVLAHELGHSWVALRQGIGVQSITLFIFGGLASLEKESKTPAGAFWVAIAGPLVSFFLFGLLTILGYGTHATGAIAAILALLASINLALACFNLIPGLPLDGGNILKAIVWKVTGNPYQGIKVASRVGQVFGWVAIATGLLPLFISGSFGNLWNLIIGWFLVQNAGRAAQVATVQEQMVNLTAADAVLSNSPVVLDHLTLREFADQFIVSSGQWRKFLVTNPSGQLVGTISVDALNSIPAEEWIATLVRDLMQPIEASTTIAAAQPLLEVVKQLEDKHLTTLSVVAENGVLVGLLEKTAIQNLLQRQKQVAPV